jgi:hypothetical protein
MATVKPASDVIIHHLLEILVSRKFFPVVLIISIPICVSTVLIPFILQITSKETTAIEESEKGS